MNIRIISLYSGSTGNAFVISGPDGAILIDAGKNAKQLRAAMDEAKIDCASLCAIFLTHEHNDHTAALSVFLKKHDLPVHLPSGCVYKLENDPAIAPHLYAHPPVHTECVAGMTVTSFPTPHDSRASVGYRIEIPCGNTVYRIGYATDIGYVSKDVETGLWGCDAVILESNHDVDMLTEGIYPDYLKKRILSRRGHLSNPESAVFAARLCENGTKSLMLAHLSQENNTPDTAYDACVGAVADSRIRICVAAPDRITEMLLEFCKESV